MSISQKTSWLGGNQAGTMKTFSNKKTLCYATNIDKCQVIKRGCFDVSALLGIDLHRQRSYVVLMDNQGKLIDQRRLPDDSILD